VQLQYLHENQLLNKQSRVGNEVNSLSSCLARKGYCKRFAKLFRYLKLLVKGSYIS